VNRREFALLAAGAPLTLRRALTAPRPRALVTCDAEARLAIVDLGSFRVLGHIRTLPDPRAIELVGRRAVVCHTAVGAVSIVDGQRVRHVLHGFEEPRYTAAHPDIAAYLVKSLPLTAVYWLVIVVVGLFVATAAGFSGCSSLFAWNGRRPISSSRSMSSVARCSGALSFRAGHGTSRSTRPAVACGSAWARPLRTSRSST